MNFIMQNMLLFCLFGIWQILFFCFNLFGKINVYSNIRIENINSSHHAFDKNIPELWIHQWFEVDSTFSIKRFTKKQVQGIKIQWSTMNNNILEPFEAILTFSNDRNLAIDLYSYGTIIESRNEKKMVSFSGDTEVQVINFTNKKAGLIYHASTYEILQDCFWINNNEFVLLGCTQDSLLTPFIWKYNLRHQTKEIYIYSKSYTKYCADYFYQKFPIYTKWSE